MICNHWDPCGIRGTTFWVLGVRKPLQRAVNFQKTKPRAPWTRGGSLRPLPRRKSRSRTGNGGNVGMFPRKNGERFQRRRRLFPAQETDRPGVCSGDQRVYRPVNKQTNKKANKTPRQERYLLTPLPSSPSYVQTRDAFTAGSENHPEKKHRTIFCLNVKLKTEREDFYKTVNVW